MKKYIVAITGASGSIFGIRLLKELINKFEIHLTISSTAFPIIKHETGIDWNETSEKSIKEYFKSDRIFFYAENALFSPISSGSFITDGMFIVPCSMKTLSAIANGYASNLIERAADVIIKEGKKLILSPREMPFNAIHLENMLKLARLGVTIATPAPAFYNKPQNIDDVIDFIVGKILDSISIEHNLFNRWDG